MTVEYFLCVCDEDVLQGEIETELACSHPSLPPSLRSFLDPQTQNISVFFCCVLISISAPF